MRRGYTGILVALLAFARPLANPAIADTRNYQISLKGTRTGVADVGMSLLGNITFSQNSARGIGLITGKAPAVRRSFSGKFTTRMPERLGLAPGGFVSSAGTISGQPQ